ncbi:SPOR domain-containing protein [Asaia astilbis]|uniref:SPOR domain-containing protein n=1 Tax=Asaia astilbis TaxID=610244 RepID=UPI000471C98A|nr:SPOR domain-containing protein [Asaia astilbis]
MRSVKTLSSLLGTGLALSACHHDEAPRHATPHYEVGQAWQGSETWFYPTERFDLRETGLAVIQQPPKGGVTADGELWSAQAMTGAHQTLQLPAIVSVRNLVNGRTVQIRLNDRGPSSSGRLLAVTPGVADLLGMGKVPTPVEVTVDEALSRQIAESNPNAPKIDITAAPREAIVAQSLDDGTTRTLGIKTEEKAAGAGSLIVPEMPRVVMQGMAQATLYRIELGSFSGHTAAARVSGQCGAEITPQQGGAGTLPWLVSLGPFTTVPEADRALTQARQCGATGAHIVVK